MSKHGKNITEQVFEAVKAMKTAGMKSTDISKYTNYGEITVWRITKSENWKAYQEMKKQMAEKSLARARTKAFDKHIEEHSTPAEEALVKTHSQIMEMADEVAGTENPAIGTVPLDSGTAIPYVYTTYEEQFLNALNQINEGIGKLVAMQEANDAERKAYRERKRNFWQKQNQDNNMWK